jgi:hypothetical protein
MIFVMCEVKSVVAGNGAHTSATISDEGKSFSRGRVEVELEPATERVSQG